MTNKLTAPADSLMTSISFDPVTVFESEEKMNALITQIREEAGKHVPDMTTQAGRDAIKSNAYAVTRSKTYIEEVAKAYIEPMDKKIKGVRAVVNHAKEKLDMLRDTIKDPVVAFEKKDELRKQNIKDRLDAMEQVHITDEKTTSEMIKAKMDELYALYQFGWEEYLEVADRAKDRIEKVLQDKLAAREQYEADQVALKKLQDEKAARDAEMEELRAFKAQKEKEEAEAALKATADAKLDVPEDTVMVQTRVTVPETTKEQLKAEEHPEINTEGPTTAPIDDDGTPGLPHPPAEPQTQLHLTDPAPDKPSLADRIHTAREFVSIMAEAQPGNDTVYATLNEALDCFEKAGA